MPILGGVLLVMLLVGAEPADFLRLEYREMVPGLIAALLAHPLALAAFLGALGLVAAGGSILMFAVKAGTLTVLTAGERAAGHIEHPPLHLAALTRANAFAIERFTSGLRRLFRDILLLGAILAAAYAVVTGAYAFVVFGPPLIEAIDGPVIVTPGVDLAGRPDHADQLPLPAHPDRRRGGRLRRRRGDVTRGSAAGARRADHCRRARRHPRR